MNNVEKILIVGGNGYIGKCIFDLLKTKNIEIYRTSRDKENLDEKLIKLDLLNKEKTIDVLKYYKFSLIINASGFIYYSKDGESEKTSRLFLGNVCTVSNLMDSIIELEDNRPKIIHLSSMAVYGNNEYLPVDESHPTHPESIYGISKLTAENVIKYLSNKHNVSVLVLRLPGIFGGSRKSGAIYNFIRNAIRNENITIDNKSVSAWDTIYIETLTQVILDLIKEYRWKKNFKILNVAYGKIIGLDIVASMIKGISNSKSKVVNLNKSNNNRFYLENKELMSIINIESSLEDDLKKYMKTIKNEVNK